MIAFIEINLIQLREPVWLLVVFVPLFFYLIKRFLRLNNISQYTDINLKQWVVFPTNLSPSYLLSKNTAYIFAWFMFSIALSGPRIPYANSYDSQITRSNIMVIIDLSRSMKATDIVPNRLRRAINELYEFLDVAKDHRVGITVFTARPHLFVPLTTDYNVLKSYIPLLDDLTFPTLGSNPISAIELAVNELSQLDGASSMLLITDGDFQKTKKHASQMSSIMKSKIPLYILGIGTQEGESVQLQDGTWLQQDTIAVISKLNESELKSLAKTLNGTYSPAYDNDSDWDLLYHQGMLKHHSVSSGLQKEQQLWNELFIYPLAISLALFSIALLPYKFIINKNILTLALIFIIPFLLPFSEVKAFENNHSNEKKAYTSYNKGNFPESNEYYSSLSGYQGYFGQGSSLYKIGAYDKAKNLFTMAILHSISDEQRARAIYNLANCYFRRGDFTQALTLYYETLNYQPNNTYLKYNIKITDTLRTSLEEHIKKNKAIMNYAKQGRSQRKSNIADGESINDSVSVSISDNKNNALLQIPLPNIPNLTQNEVKNLLKIGLNNIKLANQNSKGNMNAVRTENNAFINFDNMFSISLDEQHLLWKRIFEIEQGFPAPVEKQHHVPNVNPW